MYSGGRAASIEQGNDLSARATRSPRAALKDRSVDERRPRPGAKSRRHRDLENIHNESVDVRFACEADLHAAKMCEHPSPYRGTFPSSRVPRSPGGMMPSPHRDRPRPGPAGHRARARSAQYSRRHRLRCHRRKLRGPLHAIASARRDKLHQSCSSIRVRRDTLRYNSCRLVAVIALKRWRRPDPTSKRGARWPGDEHVQLGLLTCRATAIAHLRCWRRHCSAPAMNHHRRRPSTGRHHRNRTQYKIRPRLAKRDCIHRRPPAFAVIVPPRQE